MMKTETIPTLDALALEPGLAAKLGPLDTQRVLLQCAAIQSAIAALITVEVKNSAERLLTSAEAATRMGKTERWMKGAGRKLPFARKVGLSWGWVESGLSDWLRRRKST